MRSLSSSPLTGSDAVSSRFAARYRRYAAARSSATVAMASLVMGSDSIIRSALRRACRVETNKRTAVGVRNQWAGIPSWLPAEPTPTTVSALRPARCLVYWFIGVFRAPVIDTPRVPKMCNLRPPGRNPPVKGSDLSSWRTWRIRRRIPGPRSQTMTVTKVPQMGGVANGEGGESRKTWQKHLGKRARRADRWRQGEPGRETRRKTIGSPTANPVPNMRLEKPNGHPFSLMLTGKGSFEIASQDHLEPSRGKLTPQVKQRVFHGLETLAK